MTTTNDVLRGLKVKLPVFIFIYAVVTTMAVFLCSVYLQNGWSLLSPFVMAALMLTMLAHQHRLIVTKRRCKEQLRQTKWLMKHLHDAVLCKRRYRTCLDQEVSDVLTGRKEL
jgi:Flp pilus assembly protein TadB